MGNAIKTINDYDFFDLIGLFDLDQKEKAVIADKINEIIWKEFLLHHLENMLQDKDIEAINRMSEFNKDSEEMLTFILKQYPKVKDILQSITIKVKKDMLLELLNHMKEETTEPLAKEKLHIYAQAKELAKEEEWQELHHLMTNLFNES